MLVERDAAANLAVRDLRAAKKFYEGTLGLAPVGREGRHLIAYRSLEAIVRALKAKGVAFEHYDLPGMTRKGDVHVAAGMKAAWFKDPDGNILNIVNG
jgi:catechol-2,3-dioxygenase